MSNDMNVKEWHCEDLYLMELDRRKVSTSFIQSLHDSFLTSVLRLDTPGFSIYYKKRKFTISKINNVYIITSNIVFFIFYILLFILLITDWNLRTRNLSTNTVQSENKNIKICLRGTEWHPNTGLFR